MEETTQVQKTKTRNGFATTGLTLGILSGVFNGIGIIPFLAIIFSGIGLAKVKTYEGDGKVKAWIGLILGIIYMLMNMHSHGHFG